MDRGYFPEIQFFATQFIWAFQFFATQIIWYLW